MELKRYLRVVASTGDDDDDYSMVEISNRRAREAADRIEKLEAALRRWPDYGCPDCGGDCFSANPPVSCCIMMETREALEVKDE